MMAATIETNAISSDATVSQRFTRFSFACSFWSASYCSTNLCRSSDDRACAFSTMRFEP
nr:MAG TPA: hypothetical protein [Caudoviricetes sp.]